MYLNRNYYCSDFDLTVNRNWYCSEFSLSGHDLGFTTRFWISIIELSVIMNFFTVTERNKKSMDLTIALWHSTICKLSYINLLRVFVFELFELWTMLNVLLFLTSIFSIWFMNKVNNLRIIFFLIAPPYLWKGFYKISPFRQSICLWCACLTLCLCPSFCNAFFSRISTQWVFLMFCMRMFCHIF